MNLVALTTCAGQNEKNNDDEIISINDDIDDTQVRYMRLERSLEGINRHVPCTSQID